MSDQIKPKTLLATKQIRTLTRTAEMDDSDVADVFESQVLELKPKPETVDTATETDAATKVPIATQTDGDTIAGVVTEAEVEAIPNNVDDIVEDNKKPFKIKDVTRNVRKSVVAGSLAEMRPKVAEKFRKTFKQLPAIHLDCDGTEIDDEEYFHTLEDNTELVAVFPGEQWLDPIDYAVLVMDRELNERRTAYETKRLSQLISRYKQTLVNDAELDKLSNMDPNSLVDLTGKELMESG